MSGSAIQLLLPDGTQGQMRGDASGNAIISSSSTIIPTYTWATKPSSPTTGQIIYISNAGTKGSHWFYDGTRWKPVGGQCLLATLDTASANATNTPEIVVFQYQVAAGMWQLGDRLRFTGSAQKSGTTDSGTWRIRIGTAGTIADTSINVIGALGASIQSNSASVDIRLNTATTAQLMLPLAGISSSSSSAQAAAVTITSASANALFYNITMNSSGASNTIALTDGQLWLIASAN